MSHIFRPPFPFEEPTPEALHEARVKAVKAHLEYEDRYEAGSTDEHTMLDIADTAIAAMADLIELYFEALCYKCAEENNDDWESTRTSKTHLN